MLENSHVEKTPHKSLALSFSANLGNIICQLISSVILSRLLRPDEIGIYSVGAVLASLASVIRDFGVGEYLIQENETSIEKTRTAFTLNLIVSWAMACLFLLLRNQVALFYRSPGVGYVLAVLSCNFLFIPFGAVFMALFRREMNFIPLYWASIASSLISAITSIGLAFLGFSYMSLAWGSLSGVISTVIVSWVFQRNEQVLVPSLKGIREMISFGLYVNSTYIIDRIGKSLPELIIGRAINLKSVGLFSRASGLFELFNRSVLAAVDQVALPYFSNSQRSGKKVEESFLGAISYVTVISWPLSAFCFLMAKPLILFLYGPAWVGAIVLVRILCLSFALDSTFSICRELLIGLGRVRKSAGLQFNTQIAKAALMLIAAPFGLNMICATIVVSALFSVFLTFRALKSTVDLTAVHLLNSVRQSAAVAAISSASGAILWLISNNCQLSNPLQLLLVTLGVVSSWLIASRFVNHPILRELPILIRQMRKKEISPL